MKILLIRPPAPNKLSFTKILDSEPLELEYLHTVLMAAGFDDYIYDGLIEIDTIEQTIERENPDVVAITGYITQQNLMLRFCKIAKDMNPEIITIIGGVHAMLNFRNFYDSNVDYIFKSSDPNILVELLMLENKDAENLKKISGLCFKDSESNWIENTVKRVDINSLPVPDRSFFNKNKKYYRYLELTEVATIKTSFSCLYSCNFCYCTLLNDGKYQARDLSLIIEELKSIETKNVQIVDDDFLADKKRLYEFIRLIKENKIDKKFICYARADFVAENEDLIADLAGIGFHYFLVGLEAVSDEELSSYNKKTSVDINRKCVAVIEKTSAHCIALMIAPLDATKQYFENLYEWIIENKLKYVTVSIFTPIPGTPLFDEYKSKITSTDIEDWDFLHLVLEPVKMTRKEFYKEYNKLFLRLYYVAKKSGIYDFIDLKFYKNMLTGYLRRKIRGY